MNAHAATRRAAFGVLAGVHAPHCPRGFAVLADPVYAAMERHRRAYDTLMDDGRRHGAAYCLRTRPISAAGMTSGTAEEESFHAVLATKPTTRAGAIACVRHVADIGLVTEEVSAWLTMLLGSPLVA